MNTKIQYGLLIIPLLAGLCFWLRISFGLFTPYNSWTAQQDLKSGKIQIIAIGMPFMPQVRNRVAGKYKFSYRYVGCLATPELLNGSAYYNKQAQAFLEEKHGTDVWEKIKTECDSIISTNPNFDENQAGNNTNNSIETE